MFTAYLCLGGHYASEGDLINEFLRYYNEYKSGIPKAPVYGFRLRITLDETGEKKRLFSFLCFGFRRNESNSCLKNLL